MLWCHGFDPESKRLPGQITLGFREIPIRSLSNNLKPDGQMLLGSGKLWFHDKEQAGQVLLRDRGGSFFTKVHTSVLWGLGPPYASGAKLVFLFKRTLIQELSWLKGELKTEAEFTLAQGRTLNQTTLYNPSSSQVQTCLPSHKPGVKCLCGMQLSGLWESEHLTDGVPKDQDTQAWLMGHAHIKGNSSYFSTM